MTTYNFGDTTSNLLGSSLTIAPGGSIIANNIAATTASTALSLNGNGSGALNLNTASSGGVVVGLPLNVAGSISINGTAVVSLTRNVTNLTITDASNVVSASNLMTTGSSVIVNGSAPTSAGQQLTTVSATGAEWQSPATFVASAVVTSEFIYGSGSSGSYFVAPGKEVGMVFTLNNTSSIVSLAYYHVSSISSTSRTLRLWTSYGALLASGTTSGETTGWNSATIANPVTLYSGKSYVMSFSAGDGFAGIGGYSALPTASTPGTATLVSAVYSTTPGTFPSLNFGTGFFGIDVNASALTSLGQAPAVQFASNSSVSGSINLNPRIIWGYFNPSPSTVPALAASYGFASSTYLSLGNYTIIYTNSFLYLPTIIINAANHDAGKKYDIYTTNQSTTGCNIVQVVPNVVFVDIPFYLLIIGF